MNKVNTSRRQFLGNLVAGSAGAALLATPGFSVATATRSINGVKTSVDGYKALVCVYLFGGNDSFNMLPPPDITDDSGSYSDCYQAYQALRGNSLARTNVLTPTGSNLFNETNLNATGAELFAGVDKRVGFAPELAGLKGLFDAGKLAIQGNVGSLNQHVTPGGGNFPRGLFAHDLQQTAWQSALRPNSGYTGWAGRMMDMLDYGESEALGFLGKVSLLGHNTWQTGAAGGAFYVGTAGANKLSILNGSPKKPFFSTRYTKDCDYSSYSTWCKDKSGKSHWEFKTNPVDSMANLEYSNKLERAYAMLLGNATTRGAELSKQLADYTPPSSSNPLVNQLAMVNRLIEIGEENHLRRQVFFVGMGGFDTHHNQHLNHPELLQKLNEALVGFYNGLTHKDKVTTFTMSDFGRKLTPNGNGTDHGWGGHQLVLGGSVEGGKIYGTLPQQKPGISYAVPTTGSEEMFASLARWFGLPEGRLGELFPHYSALSDSSALASVGRSKQINYFNT